MRHRPPTVLVPATHVDPVVAFYTAILGEPLGTRSTPRGLVALFASRPRGRLLVLPAASRCGAPGTVAVHSPGTAAVIAARLRRAGLALRLRPVAQDHEWRVFETRDPEGNRVLVAIQTERAVGKSESPPR
jgi:catechol 2,3-dioxygenase-like lactoylglutathione lyase family enzyme